MHLCLHIHNKVKEIVDELCSILVSRSNGDLFEVVEQNSNFLCFLTRTCSCRRWQVYGIPCATIIQMDANVYQYVDHYFTITTYCMSYAEAIFPIPDNDKLTDDTHQLFLQL